MRDYSFEIIIKKRRQYREERGWNIGDIGQYCMILGQELCRIINIMSTIRGGGYGEKNIDPPLLFMSPYSLILKKNSISS